MPTVESVQAIFNTAKDGFRPQFMEYLTDDTSWSSMGSGHNGPLSGTYPSKEAVLSGFGENAEYNTGVHRQSN